MLLEVAKQGGGSKPSENGNFVLGFFSFAASIIHDEKYIRWIIDLTNKYSLPEFWVDRLRNRGNGVDVGTAPEEIE